MRVGARIRGRDHSVAGASISAVNAAVASNRLSPQPQRWVCFDVGEVLIDETRIWSTWADVLGVPRFTFLAAIGAAVAAGGDHADVFAVLGIEDWRDREDEVQQAYGGFCADDLYPDVLPTLSGFHAAGFGVAVVANQPARRHAELQALGVAPDVMAMSEALGVEKPATEFFRAALDLMGDPDPAHVVYVGDRLDNDVRPALSCGLRAVWLRRGPWGLLTREPEDMAVAQARTLEQLYDQRDSWWR